MINQSAKDRADQYVSLLADPVKLKRYLGGGTDGGAYWTLRVGCGVIALGGAGLGTIMGC